MPTARVFVVEDDVVVSTDIEETLNGLGYLVCGTALSAEEAIEEIPTKNPDVVLMDIQLEGKLDGIGAATQLKKQQGNLPIIYVTAFVDETTVNRAKRTDPFGYVVKPFREMDLRIAIEMALHRRGSSAPSPEGQSKSVTTFEEEPQKAAEQEAFDSKNQNLIDSLQSIHFFSKLSRKDIQHFLSLCSQTQRKQGQFIFYEGDEEPCGVIVTSGRVSLVKTSLSGRELIVDVLLPFDSFGLILALEKDACPLTARAQKDSEVLLVPKSAFLSLLSQFPSLYEQLVGAIQKRLRSAYDICRALAHDKVEKRIASSLWTLLPQFTSFETTGNKKGQSPEIIRMTRQELAGISGVALETAVRVTKAMERAGILDLSQWGTIQVVDLVKLQGMIDS